MSYMKIILPGLLGAAVAWFLIFFIPGGNSLVFGLIRNDLVKFLGEEPSPTPIPVISPNFWEKIASDHALSSVAIQSFKNGEVVREGNGIVISSDGIIATTFDVVSGADVLQVFYEDKILRAQSVKYDGFKNLALLKVNVVNIDVARLDRDYQFRPGQDVIVSGKVVELSNPTVFVRRGMIGHVLSKNIVLDTEPTYFLSGSKVINNSGIVVGMAYLQSGTVGLIKAEIIDDFIKKYFEVIKKQ